MLGSRRWVLQWRPTSWYVSRLYTIVSRVAFVTVRTNEYDCLRLSLLLYSSREHSLLGVEEGKPRLGLIDYGQVKQLSKKTRLLLCKLIIALDDDNRDEIVALMKELGYKSRDHERRQHLSLCQGRV